MSPVYDCGLNVVVLEEDTMNIQSIQTFNMTVSNTSKDIESFVNMTESLPSGTVMALASNNPADLHESEEVMVAIEELGSQYIREMTEGGSWALLGRKGAPKGSVPEAASNHGPVEIVSHGMPVALSHENDTLCEIFMEANGTGSTGGLKVTINGQYNESLWSDVRVIIAVVKEDRCELEFIHSYSVYYSKHDGELVSLINTLSMGRIVIVSIYSSGRSSGYSGNLKYTMELLGSSLFRYAYYRDTWAIIGRKGAAMGSVTESLIKFSSSRVPVVSLGAVMKLDTRSCENELYPLDCFK
jgi:hypothetical protein